MTHPGNMTAVYVRTAATLILLLGLTITLAFIDMGPFNILVALVIASVKALLVALFFMHVRSNRGITRIVAFAGILWLSFMFTLTLCDFLTRS
jgi:cytochrome c oxidase subunit 4